MDRPLPIIICRDDPDIQNWDDPQHGQVSFRLLVDGAAGPSEGVVQGIAIFGADGFENPHRHDRPETVHLLEGTGTARLGDREVDLNPGDTVFVPAGTIHEWRAGTNGMRLLFTFPADRFDDVAYRFGADA